MQLRHWKTQWIPLQIYVLIVGLKVKELLTMFLRTDTRLHQESTEKGWNTIIETAAWGTQMIKYLTMTIEKQKNIALIAHDGKKQDMLKWCMDNKEILQQHNLSGTGTTARMIADHVGLKIKGYNSGPLGGDQQIGAKIVEGNIDMVIFFSDPLAAQPHDPDVKALLRIAQVYDIPIANNIATADFMIHSTLMNEQYSHQIENFKNTVDVRVKEMQ